ncbi:FecR domain-containing protein [Paraglaciecola sp.]|uniref:FecR family protein n=1 Tax=Paraglaciecola sp. TaxID=1920173 RepID=UPI0030F3DEF4
MVNYSSTLLKAAEWAQQFESTNFSALDWQAFESWLAESDNNRQAFEQVQFVWMETSVGSEELTAILALSSEPESAKPLHHTIKEWFLKPSMLTTSLVASVLVVIVLSYFSISKPSSENNEVVIQTANGESRQVKLEDGTLLSVKPSTQLAYQYSSELRLVRLTEGEVFFDVARNPTRPFEIVVGDNIIQVLGTSFDVKFIKDSMNVEVTKGVVSVAPSGAFTSLRLTIGNGVSIEPNGRIIPLNQTSSNRSAALVFENQSLTNIFKDIDRYFPEKLTVGAIKDHELYSGIIYLDNLDKVLTQLSLISDTDISYNEQAGLQVKGS